MNAAAARESRTMLDKIWAEHTIVSQPGGEDLLYVDLNLVHEGGTFMAFDAMRAEARRLRKPKLTLAVTDHYLPSLNRSSGVAAIPNPAIRNVVEWLAENTREFGIEHIGPDDPRQGITHVIAPELGLTQPGLLITCPDSHTATQGALGTLAMPIGHSNQLRHVFSTQTLWQRKPLQMRITIDGTPGPHVTAKDIVLAIIGRIGTAGGTGSAIEFAGSTIRSLSMEGRMTVCNMAIEAGARAGMVAVDDVTIEYLRGRRFAPKGPEWDQAVVYWRTLKSDADAKFDREVTLDARDIKPHVTWGTSPEMVVAVDDTVPDPDKEKDSSTWASSRVRRSPTSASTRCSSARAPTRASKTCARRLPL
jgi:3-isopropylmalate/(R)-2-methylmalate dehydratase large subunit